MRHSISQRAFTLIEILVVISIITLLVSILVPSLSTANEQARSVKCLVNLHNLGVAMFSYQSENDGYFWAFSNHTAAVRTYFWGSDADPVDPRRSAFMAHCEYMLAVLWCPSLKWGTYVPQGTYVNEPTTTYGYNAWCLDPRIWGRNVDGVPLPRKRDSDLASPSELFVFADSGLAWAPAGVSVFQNSTSLDPPDLGAWGPSTTATTHFRHLGRTNALCADGHADSFDLEGGQMLDTQNQLGFVGADNVPHYDQE